MVMNVNAECEAAIHYGLGHHAWAVGQANVVKTLEVDRPTKTNRFHMLSQRLQDCMGGTGNVAVCDAIHQVLTLTVLPATLSQPVAPQSWSMYWGLRSRLDDLNDYCPDQGLHARRILLGSNHTGRPLLEL